MAKGGKEAAKVKIGKTLQYGAIMIGVSGAEKGPEFNKVKSPPGMQFVAVSLKLENTKSASTAFIVPDEEIWLAHKEGELSKPENYRFETALDPKKPSEGHAWFIVPAEAKKFSLFFGKKTLPKICVDFEI